MASGSTSYTWCVLILGLLVGAGKITVGRGKVKKIEEGKLLRSRRDRVLKGSATAVMLALSCTCDIALDVKIWQP